MSNGTTQNSPKTNSSSNVLVWILVGIFGFMCYTTYEAHIKKNEPPKREIIVPINIPPIKPIEPRKPEPHNPHRPH